MWIKTQDRNKLIETQEVWVRETKIWAFRNGIVFLGKYESELKAKQVLDQIEEFIKAEERNKDASGEIIEVLNLPVFVMPEGGQDNE